MNMKMLGYNISNEMHKRGVTVSELSRRTNLDRSNLSERINHPESMRVAMLIRIARSIGVDVAKLLEDVG